METAAMPIIHHILILLILIVLAGMLAGRAAVMLRIPDVAAFILVGMLLGQGMHWINESSSSLINQLILIIGSTVILFDGGRNISLIGLSKVKWTVALLSVPGVLITVIVTGTAIHFIFGMEWLYALLAASVIASTDPASIIPVFRQVAIRTKVRETVESESAFNDATGSIITFALIAAITGKSALEAGPMLFQFTYTAIGGIVLGVIIGVISVYTVAHLRLGILRDYTTIAMLTTAIAAFLLGDLLHVSGFMATFVAGLIWGNPRLLRLKLDEKETEIVHFSDNITVMLRMLIFVLLGSQVDLALLLQYGWQSFLIVFVLMFVARPITVLACSLPDRKAAWQRNELVFMMWVRETGVIPAVLSGMITSAGIQHADKIASITLMAILITVLLQASTTAFFAKRLGMDSEA